jgi:HSP20 family protein
MELIPTRNYDLGRFPLQRQINRLFEEFFGDGGWPAVFSAERASFPVDIAETDDEYILSVEVPGIDPKEVQVTATANTLSLKAEKRNALEKKARSFHRVERAYGAFQRILTLPGDVDPAAVKASGKDGVLTIRVGKREQAKPRAIEVKVE